MLHTATTTTTTTAPLSRRWHPCRRKLMLPLLLFPVVAMVIALTSCTEAPAPKPPQPPPPVTDTRPVGDGLKVIGYAFLGAAVVTVLGRMLK